MEVKVNSGVEERWFDRSIIFEVWQQLAWEGAWNLRLFHMIAIQLKRRHMTSTLGDSLGENRRLEHCSRWRCCVHCCRDLGCPTLCVVRPNSAPFLAFLASLYLSIVFNPVPRLSQNLPFYFSCKRPPLTWDGETVNVPTMTFTDAIPSDASENLVVKFPSTHACCETRVWLLSITKCQP
jgi:hypothetical protein